MAIKQQSIQNDESYNNERKAENEDHSSSGNIGSDNNSNEQSDETQQNESSDPEDDEVIGIMVCAGATCTCSKAQSPTNPASLKVISHSQYTINDEHGTKKYIATTKENNLLALNFGTCIAAGRNNAKPCTASFEWKDFYEKVTLPGNAHVLLDKSTATCKLGGKIAIKTPGQQQSITEKDLNEANAGSWSTISSLANEQDVEILESSNNDGTEAGAIVQTIGITTENSNSCFPRASTINFHVTKFKKTPSSAEINAIDWVIYNASDATVVSIHNNIGKQMSAIFKTEGKYIVEAYGQTPCATNRDQKLQKQSAFVVVQIKKNEPSGIQIQGNRTTVRLGDPIACSIKTLFPTTKNPLDGGNDSIEWQVLVQGGATPELSTTRGLATIITANEKSKYVIIARYNGNVTQSAVITATTNLIKEVSCVAEERLNKVVSFAITKFEINPPLPDELTQVKWQCIDDKKQPVHNFPNAGNQGTVVKHSFDKPGIYTIYPFLRQVSESIKTTVHILQPTLKYANWLTPEGKNKTETGWDAKNLLRLIYSGADGLKVNVEIGVTDKKGSKWQIFTKAKNREIKNDIVSLFVTLKKDKWKDLIKDGDLLYAKITSASPGYDSLREPSTQPAVKLKMVTGEKILSRGFYDAPGAAGKELSVIEFGKTVYCRIYAANMQKVSGFVYKMKKHHLIDHLVQRGAYSVNENGYAEFPFEIKADWTADKNIVSFQLVGDEDTFRTHLIVYNLPDNSANNGIVKVARNSIQTEQKKGTCPRCTAKITEDDLKKMFPELTKTNKAFNANKPTEYNKYAISISDLATELNTMFAEFEINTCRRKSYILAQMAMETGNFTICIENLGKEKANKDYGNKNGNGEHADDGFNYRGRGCTQLTGRSFYKRFGKYVGKGEKYFIENPDEICKKEYVLRSAGWDWTHGVVLGNGSELPLNPKADIGNFKRICELIQGSAITFSQRKTKLEQTIKPVIYNGSQCIYEENNTTTPVIDFHIYQSGKIEKHVPKEETFNARYYYHDKDGVPHYLGGVDFHKTTWRDSTSTEHKKDKNGANIDYVELMHVHDLMQYSSPTAKFKMKDGSVGSGRFYIDIDAFACFVGALLEENIEDLGFNGFSTIDGDTAGGSISHKNGMIGDVRYLNTNKNADATNLFSPDDSRKQCNPNFDYERQKKLNDAFYKFGFAQYNDVLMLSEYFTINGQANTLLPHTKHFADMERDVRHYHHLHLQGLKISLITKIEKK